MIQTGQTRPLLVNTSLPKRKFITDFEVFFSVLGGLEMCEFKVILEGKEVFKDVVYAKMERDRVILRDVLGESLQLGKCRIVEVDVNSTRLVLARL